MIYLNCKTDELFPKGRTCLTVVRENIEKFSKYNVNAEYLDELEANIVEGESTWDDNMERMDLKTLTSIKDDYLLKCFDWGRELSIRVKLALKKNANIQIEFPSKDLLKARHSESKMISLLEILIKIATDKDVFLAPHGQTPEVIQEGKDLLQNLRKSDYDQELKKVMKKEATDSRHKLYRKIYDTINTLNEIGRNVFSDEPEKLRLFDSPWKSSKKHNSTIYEGTVEPESTIAVTGNLTPDTLIHAENTGTTDLLVFVNTNGVIPEDYLLVPGGELTKELSELGEGKYLKLHNNDNINTGAFKITV